MGCTVNISLISAQAYLLSTAQAIYAVYITLLSNVLFSLFLRKLRLPRVKFALLASLSMGLYLLLFLTLALPFYSNFARALSWFFLASFGNQLFLWMNGELAIKHLDPARAQYYFSYLILSDELGALLAILLLKTYAPHLNLHQTLYAIVFLFGGILSVLIFHFVPKKNFEVKFTHKEVEPPVIEKKTLRTFLVSFSLLSFCLGAFKVGEDYFIKVVLREHVGSYEAIRNIVANYMMVASVLTIGGGALTGRWIARKHLSPTLLISAQTSVVFGMCLLCLFFPTFYFFIAFEIVRRLVQNCLYAPANQMILSSFVGDIRNRFRSVYSFYYFIAAGLALSFVFSFTQKMPTDLQLKTILLILIALLGVSLAILPKVRRSLTESLYAFVATGHKTASIIAVNLLSFLRPRGYRQEMDKLLTLTPKKILRKTIIMGLGYDHDDSSVDTIIKEFQSEKEEIQIAVLDALKISRNYKATQFMVKIIMAQEKSKSLRVRMNASAIVASIYGRKAIPFLLNGLEDSEPRIVANTLETLLAYKDKGLIPSFLKFVDSPYPRIRANALMGLASFKSTRATYLNTVREILKGKDLKMISSILYIIGKRRDDHFMKELEELNSSPLRKEEIIKASLAWVLTRRHDPKGFELMGEMLALPYEGSDPNSSVHLYSHLHFLSQLSRETRFDLIQYLVTHHVADRVFLTNMGNHLRHSIYDFHEEIEYFHMMVEELSKDSVDFKHLFKNDNLTV
ncbi:MAG: MFS transporter [bacterium]